MKSVLKWLGLSFVALIILWIVGSLLYRRSQRDQIYAAVLQYGITNQDSSMNPKHLKVYFVDIEGKEPSPKLVELCKNAGFSVRGRKQALNYRQLRGGSVTTDIATQEPGVIVRFARITWASNKQPFVISSGGNFTMVKEYGAWRVGYEVTFTL